METSGKMKQQNLKDTEVISEDKSLVAAFEDKIERLKCGYENMDIVIGSADSRQVVASSTPAAEVVNFFCRGVTATEEKTRHVTVPSIPPVINPPDTEEKISSINAGLLHTTIVPGTGSVVRG